MGWRSFPTNRWTCLNGCEERVHPRPLCYLCISTLNDRSLCKQVGGVSDRSCFSLIPLKWVVSLKNRENGEANLSRDQLIRSRPNLDRMVFMNAHDQGKNN